MNAQQYTPYFSSGGYPHVTLAGPSVGSPDVKGARKKFKDAQRALHAAEKAARKHRKAEKARVKAQAKREAAREAGLKALREVAESSNDANARVAAASQLLAYGKGNA